MQTRKIGALDVSIVGLGCNNFGRRLDAAGTAAVVDAALDAGVTLLDTADSYGDTQSEALLGPVLAGRRARVVLATKFGLARGGRPGGARAAYIRSAVEESLRRLRTDWIDLYQLHTPDPATPIAETLGALDELVRSGKVREIGASNFTPAQLEEADAAAGPGAARFVSLQNEYSLLERAPERDVLPACARLGLGFLPYFPLASGLLTGKYRDGAAPTGSRLDGSPLAARFLSPRNVAAAEALRAFATARGRTLLELAISWLAARPEVASVIAGATRPDQVRDNAAAAGWALTPEELADVDRLAPAA